MANSKDNPAKRLLVRFAGALAMPRVAKKMQQKHHIHNPQAEFQAALTHWVEQGLAGKAFYAGEQPGLLDTSVFGVLHSAHGMGVIETAATTNPAFAKWYEQCRGMMSA